MSEQYKDTNLNFYIKVRLTDDGIRRYKEYYSDYGSDAPGIDIDDEGFTKFQIHDFMHIFGKRLFMGATLPCRTNCKIQVKDEWHTPEEEPVPFGKYANERYPQIPCLVDIKNYGYGIRYWNVKEKCWDDESCDDYYCDMDRIKKWAYIKEDE